MKRKSVTLAITGASGAPYALRLIECLLAANCQVLLLISRAAEVVIRQETSLALPSGDNGPELQQEFFNCHFATNSEQLRVYGRDDWFAPVASGSSAPRDMIICPASGGTLSAIACGASNNLIERAADVVLKERRRLILVTRETPLSTIHLQNMLSLSQMGVTLLPASPGFYQQPQTIADLIDFVVARILDQLQIEQALVPPWGEGPP
ncbi:flavin prenyltransferase UbiX [Halioxenophilus sp. WMMB6]|uniref:flavin prenyltransferase UbiX n=1 Tax=Halioxenophilus sp. WMMB6 TaxID=3073815 RepID=UPI00295F38F2|nr:flavin prenyltransferase UbiX [Halioxenophilus sp. WMMB6]